VPDPDAFDAGQSTYSVTLPSFEGPLDLLLHLCQKHELNILDIPISFVTEKYLEYLAVMQLMDLDIASEYLLMAATLAHIKSKMLLPAPPPGQEDDALLEEEDPREALIKRLLEYQKYKQAAADLSARGVAGRDIFTRGAAIEEAVHTGLAPLAEVPLYALMEAFQRILAKTKVKLTHDIVADRISITDRIHELAALLQERKRVTFEALFDGLVSKFDVVITFLALLEMSKLRMTRLFQTEPLAPLYVELAGEGPLEAIDSDPFADEPEAIAAAEPAASQAGEAELHDEELQEEELTEEEPAEEEPQEETGDETPSAAPSPTEPAPEFPEGIATTDDADVTNSTRDAEGETIEET
jgi:segregation and condensation protein A